MNCQVDLTKAGNSNDMGQGPVIGISAVGSLDLAVFREQCQVTRISKHAFVQLVKSDL